MEQINGVKIRQMTDQDWESISEIDRNITGNPRAPSWPQRASSHLKTYSPDISFVAEIEGRVVGFILAGIRGAETNSTGYVAAVTPNSGAYINYYRLSALNGTFGGFGVW